MDQRLFESLTERARGFAERKDFPDDEVRVEIRLHSGRTFVLERLLETTDQFVQFDGWDPADEDKAVSLIVPFHQINHVQLSRSKPKTREAGFSFRVS